MHDYYIHASRHTIKYFGILILNYEIIQPYYDYVLYNFYDAEVCQNIWYLCHWISPGLVVIMPDSSYILAHRVNRL